MVQPSLRLPANNFLKSNVYSCFEAISICLREADTQDNALHIWQATTAFNEYLLEPQQKINDVGHFVE